MRASILLTLLLLARGAPAATLAPDRGAVALDQSLLELLTDRRVMSLAAHPDDEDLATLVYLRKHLGVKTHTVFATRGEGGQNEIGDELYEELAVIRTRECLAAASISGSDVSFLDLPDFGYSKTAEETFSIWGEAETARRVKQAILEIRPHVIITNHDTTGGHGHHQAIGRALLAVWDDLQTSEQPPWLPEAVFLRITDPAAPAEVEIPVGELDRRRGMTYAEQAQAALELHRSQGRWERDLGLVQAPVRYRRVRVAGADFGPGLLGDRAPPWLEPGGVLDYASRQVRWARQTGEPSMVATFMGRALDLGRMVYASPEGEQAVQLQMIEEALVESLGLRLEAHCLDPIVTPDQPVELRVRYALAGSVPITPPVFEVVSASEGAWEFDQAVAKDDGDGRLMRGEHGELILTGRPVAPSETLPAVKHVRDRRYPTTQLDLVAHFEIAEYETRVHVRVPVELDVAPALVLELVNEPAVTTVGSAGHLFVGIVAYSRGTISGTIRVDRPGADATDTIPFTVRGDGGRTAVQVPYFEADTAAPGELVLALEANAICDAAPQVELVASARQRLRVVDARVEGDPRVGVVHTYDETLESALTTLGVRHERVSPEVVLAGDLSVFDVIFLDLRAYLTRPDVVQANDRLLDFARAGGVLICQYNKTFEWHSSYAPFALELGRDRVTDEQAQVTILAPEHPLLSFPNRIGADDFENWIQERGLYYPQAHDPAYEQLLSCADPEEEQLRNGLLHARVGTGRYVYTSMVWYRQWRAGQPGAFRVLANMLSLPLAPGGD